MQKAQKLPSGKWRCRTYHNGVVKSFTASTKREAERLAASWVYKEKNTESDKIRFGDAVQTYIEIKDGILSPSTIRGYIYIAKRFSKSFNSIRIESMEVIDIQKEINRISKEYSAKSVKNTLGLVTAVLDMYRPGFNPKVRIPAPDNTEKIIPTDEEVQLLMKSIYGTKFGVCVALAAFCSLRRSEVCAITNDPDVIHEHSITINKAMVMNPDNTYTIRKKNKSKAGYREIYPPEEIMKLIHVYTKKTPKGERLLRYTPAGITDHFTRVASKLGLNITFHSLRHYFATKMLEQNIDIKTVQKLGGWGDASTPLRIYAHATEKANAKAVNTIGDMYKTVMEE